jgi:hypothetical protein
MTFAATPEVRLAEAVDAARVLLAGADPARWSDLDHAIRRHWWSTPLPMSIVDVSVTRGPAELVVAACHNNGFVRAAAVDRISHEPLDVYAPVLALRVSDWVPEIRERAKVICRSWLTSTPVQALLALAPMAFALERRQYGGWLADLLRTALRTGGLELLAAALSAPDWRIRRVAYLTALVANRLDLDQIVHGALKDADLPIRLACAEAAFQHARANGDHDVLRRLATSRTAGIRADAIHRLAESGDLEPALAGLLDRSTVVRTLSQVVARRAGADPTPLYRDGLAESPVAIAGLGETGTAADRELLWPFVSHPEDRYRAEAVRALRRLGAQPSDVFFGLLTDPASSVVREVVRLLRPYAGTLDENLVRDLLAPDHERHVRIAGYRLMHDRGAWSRVEADLTLLIDADAELAKLGGDDLKSWLISGAATTYARPTGERRDRLLNLVGRVEWAPDSLKLVRFHIG